MGLYPPRVTVVHGYGCGVGKNPTHGIPVRNPSSGLAFAVDQVGGRMMKAKHNDLSHLLEFQTPIVPSFLGVKTFEDKRILEIQIRILRERITIAT